MIDLGRDLVWRIDLVSMVCCVSLVVVLCFDTRHPVMCFVWIVLMCTPRRENVVMNEAAGLPCTVRCHLDYMALTGVSLLLTSMAS